ncbi:MAG TPA: septum formation initiator family protein [candidate division Zixibacteria bacterium]|nr:septum formation initiator family protein [candidate division Zixibacteria bacterium]
MPRRVKQSRKILQPLAENFVSRLSNADARVRRRFMKIGLWLIGLMFFWSLMVGDYGIPRIIRLEMEKQALIESNQRILLDLIDDSRIKKMLETDQRYIEYIARTRYRMVRPNETIYYYRGF